MAGKQSQLVISEKRRNFGDTQAFCEVLGGEIAVVNDNKFDKCSLIFFTGYIKK